MNRFRVWGLSAALTAGLGGPVAAADPPAPGEPTTLANKLFGPKQPKAGPATPQRPPTVTAPLSPAVLAEALRAEQDAYLRRVSVCTELRRVAVERGDESLVRQADELERQTAALYNARVAALGVSRVKSSLPDPSAVPPDGGPPAPDPIGRAAASRLVAPAAPVPGSTTAQVREVKP
jgi:hypothetical protein